MSDALRNWLQCEAIHQVSNDRYSLANHDSKAGHVFQDDIKTHTCNSPKPRLFALLIGIDFYDHVRSLRCAVADTLAFKEYLENSLCVPPAQIRTLINSSASRVAIIDSLRSLQKDDRIENGDPIFIFFAGHGAEIPTSDGDAHAKIQSLVPQDFCAKPGQEVPSITDRTFGALIDLIAEEKGDNITVVLDCCHAASGTRGNEDVRVRSIEIERTMQIAELDSDIPEVTSRSLVITPGFVKRGLRSHILLAACSASERAVESNEHGFFSSALLKLFRSVPPGEITYQDVLNHIDSIPGQNPQCEGVHQNRYLFNGKVSRPVRQFYMVQFKDNQFVLNAGAIHGIARGAQFDVFEDEKAMSLRSPLATLIVDAVGSFSATLKFQSGGPSFTLNTDLIVVQTRAGGKEDLRLYIPMEDQYLPCYHAWSSLTQAGKDFNYNITLLESPEAAHVQLVIRDNRVVFIFRDERITQYGLKQAYFDVELDADEVARVLKALAHYFWKLDITNTNPEITNSIEIEFYQLDPSDDVYDDDTGMPEMTPIPPNICRDNVIDFVVDEDAPYGIRLTNKSPYDFYPYLFYFDNSDLSIAEYYQPPTSGPYMLDVPLKANGGSLTIGYGSGGVAPFSYFLRDRQNVDVGFLKLFVSTKRIDLSVITQTSPFGETARNLANESRSAGEPWGTILLPVIQRRYPPTPETHCVQCGSLTVKSLEMRQLQTIHNLETRIKELNTELKILRQTAMDDKRLLGEQISSLQTRLGCCAQEKIKLDPSPNAQDISHTQGHDNKVLVAQGSSNKIKTVALRLFNRVRRFRLRRLLP